MKIITLSQMLFTPCGILEINAGFTLNIIKYYVLDKGNAFYAAGIKFYNTGMSHFKGLMAVHINSMNCRRLRFNCQIL